MAMFSPISHPNQSVLNHHHSRAMSQPNSSESDLSASSLPVRHWLEWAEYISLASSAIGSVVVALSGQAFYGVAPLTVALSLNVANRHRLQQSVRETQADVTEVRESVQVLEQKAVRAIWGMRQQLKGDIEAIENQLQGSVSEDELTRVRGSKQVAVLTESVASFQSEISQALDKMEQQFHQEMAPLQGSLIELQAELERISKENETIIKPHIKRLLVVVKQLQKPESNNYLPRPPKPNSNNKN